MSEYATPLTPVDVALMRIVEAARARAAETERVPLIKAAGRYLTASLEARRTQPPFDASAMDGFAVKAADTAPPGKPRMTCS